MFASKLSTNKINCDCDSLALRDWRNSLDRRLAQINFEGFQCNNAQGVELDGMRDTDFPACTSEFTHHWQTPTPTPTTNKHPYPPEFTYHWQTPAPGRLHQWVHPPLTNTHTRLHQWVHPLLTNTHTMRGAAAVAYLPAFGRKEAMRSLSPDWKFDLFLLTCLPAPKISLDEICCFCCCCWWWWWFLLLLLLLLLLVWFLLLLLFRTGTLLAVGILLLSFSNFYLVL